MVSIITQFFLLCSKGHNRKNWLFNNTIRGAKASAAIYSVVETAKANNLKPYYYMNYILEKLPEMIDLEGNLQEANLEKLMP